MTFKIYFLCRLFSIYAFQFKIYFYKFIKSQIKSIILILKKL